MTKHKQQKLTLKEKLKRSENIIYELKGEVCELMSDLHRCRAIVRCVGFITDKHEINDSSKVLSINHLTRHYIESKEHLMF